MNNSGRGCVMAGEALAELIGYRPETTWRVLKIDLARTCLPWMISPTPQRIGDVVIGRSATPSNRPGQKNGHHLGIRSVHFHYGP